jgi:tetratricopeptide (TPR) repeat protein
VADYYLLVASLGLILAAAAVVTALARTVESAPSMLGRGLLYAAVGAWIGANVFSTVLERVPAWNNPLTLTEHARKIQGESFFHDFLAARMRAGVGEYAEAVRLYAMALDAAPYHEPSQVGRVVALINARDLTAAEHAMAGLSPRAAEPRERLRVSRAFVLEARGNHDQAAELYRAIINDPTPAGVEAKITALVRLTHMSQRFGMAMDVRYSLERAPFDVQRFYLFPGYHRRS